MCNETGVVDRARIGGEVLFNDITNSQYEITPVVHDPNISMEF